MRWLLKATVIAGLLANLTGIAWAHMGDKVFPIVELTDAELARIDITDGSVEDWLEVVGEPTATAPDFSTDPEYASYDPADMDFRIWLAWHRATGRIYVAMERSDDLYLNEFDRGRDKGCPNRSCLMAAQDSHLGFYVDGDHSGGQFIFYGGPDPELELEEQLLLSLQTAQWYETLAEVHDVESHVSIPLISLFADWFADPPYAQGGGGVVNGNPALSVTEFYVTPFDHFVYNNAEESVVSELYPGKVIGFSLAVMDTDSKGHTWKSVQYRPSYFPKTADQFADGVLLGPGGALPEISAVESNSWARIKASFGK